MNALEISNLQKSYFSKGRRTDAVKGISFSIKKGEIFGLLGPNGAGKSTTINMISGVVEKDSGSIRILGKQPEEDWEYVKNRMNVASAYFGLSDVLTVNQNLKVYAKLYNLKNPQDKIDDLLKRFKIFSLKDSLSNTLSSGERTRLGLCKGFLNDPELILLDEPTVGLDPDIAETTRTMIKDYQREKGASILFTSHYMYEAEELCSRIAFMSKGTIIKIDTASNLKQMIKQQRVSMKFLVADKKLEAFFRERNINVIFPAPHHVVFDISATGEDLYKIMNSLFKRGYKLKDMEIKRPSLDDVFIKISRGEK